MGLVSHLLDLGVELQRMLSGGNVGAKLLERLILSDSVIGPGTVDGVGIPKPVPKHLCVPMCLLGDSWAKAMQSKGT
jgi:hypothetical protein